MRVLVFGCKVVGAVALIAVLSPVLVPVLLLYLMDGLVSLLVVGTWRPLRTWRQDGTGVVQ